MVGGPHPTAVGHLIFEEMTEALADGKRIELRGFGSFVSKSYRARMGRNPRTGESIAVPAKRLPFFKVGKELRERVNAGASASVAPAEVAPDSNPGGFGDGSPSF
mgnify:CR=1 FL=1